MRYASAAIDRDLGRRNSSEETTSKSWPADIPSATLH